jgi:anti-repressor protein
MNNELIKVTVKNDQQLVSARDLYKGLGIKRQIFRLGGNRMEKSLKNDIDFHTCTYKCTPRENRAQY